MKKYIFILMIMTLFFGGCRSLTKKGRSVNKAEKLFESGDYYSSVEILSNTLVIEPEYKPAITLFNLAFPLALDFELNQVNKYKDSHEYVTLAKKSEKVYNLYKFSTRLRGETKEYLNFPINYENLKIWTQKTSKAYYDSAKNFKETTHIKDYKEIAKFYKKSYTFNPKYLDNLEQYTKYKKLAIQKIAIFPIESTYNYYNIGDILETSILKKLKSDNEIMEFTEITKEPKKEYKNLVNYNRILEIQVKGIDYKSPYLKQNFNTKRWYEEIKLKDGVLYTKAFQHYPSTREKDVLYKEHSYTEVSNNKKTSAKINIKYKLYDLLENKTIIEGSINEKVEDEATWTTYWGDIYPETDYESEKNIMDQETILNTVALKGVEELFNLLSEELK